MLAESIRIHPSSTDQFVETGILAQKIELPDQAKKQSPYLRHFVHDIRNLISPIVLYGDRLANSENQKDKELGNKIIKRLELVADLCTATLDRQNRVKATSDTVCVQTVIEEIVGYFDSTPLRGKIQIIREGKSTVSLCRLKIYRILHNLIFNWVEAIKDFPKPNLKIYFINTNDRLEISLIDNGPGLPSAIYQRFLFGSPTPSATNGIGLNVVQSLTSELGGEFEIKNTSDAGTHMQLSFDAA